MENDKSFFWIFTVILALLLGVGTGWWYGKKTGYDKGFNDAVKAQSAQTGIKVDTGYKNPFEKVNLNPFKK